MHSCALSLSPIICNHSACLSSVFVCHILNLPQQLTYNKGVLMHKVLTDQPAWLFIFLLNRIEELPLVIPNMISVKSFVIERAVEIYNDFRRGLSQCY